MCDCEKIDLQTRDALLHLDISLRERLRSKSDSADFAVVAAIQRVLMAFDERINRWEMALIDKKLWEESRGDL